MKSLIVEDEYTQQVIMQMLLEPYGETRVVANGRQAVEEFVRSQDADAVYDLICLDIMMPEMDGHETLKEIRRLEAVKNATPRTKTMVIMTSILKDAENVWKAYEEKCEFYMTKPIDQDEFDRFMRVLGFAKQDER